MNKDSVDGRIEHAKGKHKEATGKALHDDDLHTEGLIDQVSGKGPSEYDETKEHAKDQLDKL